MQKKILYINNIQFANIIFIKILYLLLLLDPIKNDCNKKIPILKNNICTLDYCSEDDFNNKICSINNTIVKIQWLNNIIWIGDKYFRHVNLVTFSNGDLIVESSSSKINPKRMFFGIKSDGKSFFKIGNIFSKYYSKEVSSQTGNSGGGRYYAENFVAKINGGANNGKEYLVSIGSGNSAYTELYDFDNEIIYQRSNSNFLENQNNNIRGTSYSFTSSSTYYSIFGHYYESSSYYYLMKYKFTKIDINNNLPTSNYYCNYNVVGQKISCYVSDSIKIFCFYTYKDTDTYKYGYIKIFSENLHEIGGKRIEYVYAEDETFLKCIYFKDEIGIFVYYYFYKENGNTINPQNPKILFKRSTCTTLYGSTSCNLNDYSNNFKETILDKKKFNINILLNDIIKISDNRICFISTSDDRNVLYIILIDIFETEKLVIRYYDIELYSLYHYKIFKELRSHLYKNFISFAFSFCPQESCDYEETDEYYSGFMIFNYPNGTDYSLNLTDYLLRNNDIKIDNIIIDLKEKIYIENNIFGYKYSKIQITNKAYCDTINLIASSDERILHINDYLYEDENIKLKLLNYNIIENCKIEYSYIVTEPLYQKDSDYYITKVGNDNEDSYELRREFYTGKTICYNIFLEKKLETRCEDNNCELCLNENINYCITCKNNSEIFPIETKIEYKICYDEEKVTQSDIIEEEKNEEENIYEEEEENIKEEEEKNEKSEEENKEEEEKLKLEEEKKIKIEEKEEENKEENVKLEEEENKEEYIKEEGENKNKKEENIDDINSFLVKYENKAKNEIINELPEIIKNIEIGKEYKIKGEDCIVVIKPTNSFYNGNSTYVNLSQCENILRNSYNLSSPSILTILQMEIENKNEKSLTNKVEYQIYDDKKNILDLSKCNNSNIQILYSLNDNSLDINSISDFQKLGIDILNINDSFFNDICHPYSNEENDIILKDRIKDIYQNYSICEEGCNYNEFIIENKIISCDCKIKTNISLNESNLNLLNFSDIKIDSNFAIVKCYNLVFSFKGKSKNIGFWIFLFLVIILLVLLILNFYKGIKPIKEYIIQEMKNYGYIDNDKNKKIKIISKKKNNGEKKDKGNSKRKPKKKKKSNLKSPPKKKKKALFNNSSLKNIKLSEREIMNQINNMNIENKSKKKKENINVNNTINIENNKIFNKKSRKNRHNNQNKNEEANNKILINNLILLGKSKKSLDLLQTQGVDNIEKNIKETKDKNKALRNKNKKEKSEKGNNIFNFNLININLNNIKDYTPNNSLHILNNYCFEEAIKYDMRSICAIFYIFLLSKQAIFHAFLYRSPLELFPLRFCFLIFIMASDLALNAIFYLDDKISQKYKYAKNLFLFTFNSNITIILLSTLIGFVFMTLFTNLGNSINNIRDIFKNEEKRILNDARYIVTKKRKKEIIEEINKVLKKHKIKVIILISIQTFFIMLFWYYVTVFCHIYSSTQLSWLLDSFLSILSRLVIELLLSLAFAKLYRLSIESNVQCIYKFVLFFYCFG